MDFSVGEQWVYSMEQTTQIAEGSQSVTMEMTMKVVEVKKGDDGTTAKIESILTDGKGQKLASDTITWLLNDQGLFQASVGSGKETYNPPLPLVPLPIVDGTTTQYKGFGPRETVGPEGPIDAEIHHGGWQEVDTDMGRKQAYTIQAVRTWTINSVPAATSLTMWVTPGIGVVRILSETTTQDGRISSIRRIKSHTEAKG